MAYICRDRHGTYYLRIVLNTTQRRVYRKKELRRSLGTKLKREALRKQPLAYLEAMSVFGEPVELPSARTLKGTRKLLSKLIKEHTEYQRLTGVMPETIAKRVYALELLMRLVKDKCVESYTKHDARLFRDMALKLPKRGSKEETISITTYNNYASEIMSFFAWCERECYISTNVFKGIRIKQKQLQSSYRNIFTPEDLKMIVNTLENIPNIRADRYWMPYIAYFTGCRINECCMLSKDDVYKTDGAWCIHFRQDKDYQRLKNAYSERIIPIHSELIKLGFLEYVNGVTDERLFPMLSTSAQLSQWFGKLIKKLNIGPKKTFHSFRHTFVNICKGNTVDVSLTKALIGHSSGTLAYDCYGKSLKPSVLVPVVEAIPRLKRH